MTWTDVVAWFHCNLLVFEDCLPPDRLQLSSGQDEPPCWKTLEYIKFEWLVIAFVFLQVRIHDTIRYILLMWINYVFSKQFENDCGMNNGFEEDYGLHFTRWYLQYVPCSAFAYFHFCCKWYRLYQCSRQDPRLKGQTCYSPYRVRGTHILNKLKATQCAACPEL